MEGYCEEYNSEILILFTPKVNVVKGIVVIAIVNQKKSISQP